METCKHENWAKHIAPGILKCGECGQGFKFFGFQFKPAKEPLIVIFDEDVPEGEFIFTNHIKPPKDYCPSIGNKITT